MQSDASLPQRILAAIDESEQSKKAVTKAQKLASVSKASVLLANVLLFPSRFNRKR